MAIPDAPLRRAGSPADLDPPVGRNAPLNDPDGIQRLASDPDASVWVGASAGTGKTKVLTDRVLRLLLPRADGRPGTEPGKILCLTFTKAAASEMALRIGRELGRWAVLPDADLDCALTALLGHDARPADKDAARRLFARVVDAPGGVPIMTIHSFCKSVLSRFPLEAGLHPGFEIAEEGEATRLLDQAIDQVLSRTADPGPLARALDTLATEQTDGQFRTLVAALCKERQQLAALLARHWGVEGLYTGICAFLGITAGETRESVVAAACAETACDGAALRRAVQALQAGGGKKDPERAERIARWLAAAPDQRPRLYPDYRKAFLTEKDEVLQSLAGKETLKRDPGCLTALEAEAARLQTVQERVKSAECAALTRDLILIGSTVLEAYQTLKARRGVLDYDDLVERTLGLLSGRSLGMTAGEAAPWIMYKLDQGIDHILIDEAQDTNPEQWDIVAALSAEIFAGQGAHEDRIRTLFSVGDRKQSIFSFQRAAPDKFMEMNRIFAAKSRQAALAWQDVDMDISFRSGESVLRLVDAVFASPEARAGVSEQPTLHASYRQGQASLVELWPVFETPDQESDSADLWDLPTTLRDSRTGAARLADHIARTVRSWIDSGEILPARNRPVQAGDVMILMRTRTPFVAQMVRALKLHGVPVSGVDRMVLTESLAVQDLTALAAFALLPEDDLSLACALKSPLIGLDEEALFALCYDRQGTLWSRVKTDAPAPLVAYLDDLIARASQERPYEFFSGILQRPCPGQAASAGTGLKAMRARLGDEALDPLDELLNAALDFEATRPATVQGFIHSLTRPGAGIKRQMEDAPCVRIMTVHGAKGLQAPIVILPDTLRAPTARRTERLLWPDRSGLPIPLWTPRNEVAPALYRQNFHKAQERDDAEYRRLLYVALTRAEDRLYICGHKGTAAPLAESWYHYVQKAFASLERGQIPYSNCFYTSFCDVNGEQTPRIFNNQTALPDRSLPARDQKPMMMGDTGWLSRQAPPEPTPPRPLTPSRPLEDDPAALSPLAEGGTWRFQRGILTHRLLEWLPESPEPERRKRARTFLETQAASLSPALRHEIEEEIFHILEHPDFAPLFGSGSLAEVPMTGMLADGRRISGQIDRLLVTEKYVWIVDYKTNRPPPDDPRDVPTAYRAQLRAYRDTLARIWEDRDFRCFLLWTDGPRLMEIKDL